MCARTLPAPGVLALLKAEHQLFLPLGFQEGREGKTPLSGGQPFSPMSFLWTEISSRTSEAPEQCLTQSRLAEGNSIEPTGWRNGFVLYNSSCLLKRLDAFPSGHLARV